MSIVPLYGHAVLRARVSDMVARGALPHSLLLHGPRGVGKQRFALWLGTMLLCTGESGLRPCGACQSCRYAGELAHPDLHWIFPRPRKEVGDEVEDAREDYADAIAARAKAHGLYGPASGSDGIFVVAVRAIVQAAVMSPAIGRRKVFVIGDADRLVAQEGADQAANALLKLLEEPPADTTLILTSSEPGSLLPTIRSRVVGFRVGTLTEGELGEMFADPAVKARLDAEGAPRDPADRLAAAAGAPGMLLAGSHWADALRNARRMLDAATRGDRTERIRAAFGQGASKARGSFSDTLDALTVVLHERVRSAAGAGDATLAAGAARAMEAVERAKEMAQGNVSPQLITASLLQDLQAAGG